MGWTVDPVPLTFSSSSHGQKQFKVEQVIADQYTDVFLGVSCAGAIGHSCVASHLPSLNDIYKLLPAPGMD